MPPLKGIDRGLDGDALKALDRLGHGDQIVIVDPSYSIPVDARVISYHGDSSAMALKGILNLVPIEKFQTGDLQTDLVGMRPDKGVTKSKSRDAFQKVADELGLEIFFDHRLDDPRVAGETGFYTEANHSERPTLFVRTRDPLAYACARFIVGHSQV